MKLTTKSHKVALMLFLVGIFFLPFNSFRGLGILGEYDRDSCVLFFLASAIFVFFSGKLHIPYKNSFFQILMILIGWVVLSVVFNSYDINGYYFKKATGISRFTRQFVSLLIVAIVLLITFYNIILRNGSIKVVSLIRKAMLYSLIIVVIYGSIEFLIVKFKMDGLRETLYLFDYFPFTSVNIDKWTSRISSVTFEPPALATYLLSIAGWMFSYILTEKGLKRFLPGILVILFAFLSESRAVFFIIIIQAFVFILYLIRNRKFNKLFIKIFLTSVFAGFFVIVFFMRSTVEYVHDEFTSFKIDDDVHSTSNKTRFGIQYAMFQVFLENPVVGTGYGLQAFEAKNKYPDWATEDNWEFRLKHLNEDHPNFPPGFNIYLRLLAETGIIGYAIFLLFLISILLWCYNKTFIRHQGNIHIPFIITVSMVGFVFNWLKMDTFRIYGFWLCLALLLAYSNEQRTALEKEH